MIKNFFLYFSFIFFLFFVALLRPADHTLRVVFLDVGQGDSIYIHTPDGSDILIDSGPDLSVLHELGKVMPVNDHDIELFILTHPDQDHILGSLELLERFEVRNVLISGATADNVVYEMFAQQLVAEGVRVFSASVGQTVSFGDVTLSVLFPFDRSDLAFAKKINDTSVVTELSYGDVTFLFTGDITTEVENKLVEHYPDRRIDVLKVAHHGSKTSTSQDFLKVFHPEYAVISVGRANRYGHPHPSVLQRLKEFGIEVLRTDQLGTVEFRCEKDFCKVR